MSQQHCHFTALWPQGRILSIQLSYTTVMLTTNDKKYLKIIRKNMTDKILTTHNHHFAEGNN